MPEHDLQNISNSVQETEAIKNLNLVLQSQMLSANQANKDDVKYATIGTAQTTAVSEDN